MTYVLGLNAYHADAAACLVKDGTLVAAVEEERFRRIKHWGGFPSESIRYCLAEAGIALADVEHVAVNSDNRANRWRKLAYVLTSGVGPGYVLDRLRQRGDRADVAGNLKRHLPEQAFRGAVHAVEHHLCHLASAFLVSPYDKAVAVSVDGFGDFSSAAWGLGEGGAITVDGRVYFPHSLGVFYEAMTQFIGFPHYGDEYKVMGLAPYGEPRYVEAMKQIVKLKDDGTFALDLRYFRHAAGEGANYQVKDGIPSGGRLWSDALAELLGPARDPAAPLEDRERDIARSAQVTYENAFFNLLQAVHRRYGADAVVLPGGFSYGDYLRCGAIARFSPVMDLVIAGAREGLPVLGICNGFQVLCEAHLLPGALTRNADLHFRCAAQPLVIENTTTAWTNGYEQGARVVIPVKNGEGRFVADEHTLDQLEADGLVVARYVGTNHNGSVRDIAGIANHRGNVVGLMPHPEHAIDPLTGPSADGLTFFTSIVKALIAA